MSADNDFPSSDSPRIPWREAIQSAQFGSSMAPGVPARFAAPSAGKKADRKYAVNRQTCESGRAEAGESGKGADLEKMEKLVLKQFF